MTEQTRAVRGTTCPNKICDNGKVKRIGHNGRFVTKRCDTCEGTGRIYTVSDVEALMDRLLKARCAHSTSEEDDFVDVSLIKSEFAKFLEGGK